MATKKKPSKKTTTKSAPKSAPKFGAKSDFVRSLDPKIPAKEAVKLAKEKGITLTVGLVYNIRSTSKNAGAKAPGKRGPKPKGTGMTSGEVQLRNAIADLGLVKSTEILEAVKATIRRG